MAFGTLAEGGSPDLDQDPSDNNEWQQLVSSARQAKILAGKHSRDPLF